MKKSKGMACLALGIVFALFSVLAFVIPTEKTAAFWVTYGFTLIAFVAQIGVWRIALGRTDSPKSRFLGLPILFVGIVYLALQLVAFAVFMAEPALPVWAAVVVSSIILAISAGCMIAGEAGKDEAVCIEKKVNSKVFYLKALQVDVDMLAQQEKDEEMRAELRELADAIRMGDPMSDESLADIEEEIVNHIKELKTAADKKGLISDVRSLLMERNKKIMLRKGR